MTNTTLMDMMKTYVLNAYTENYIIGIKDGDVIKACYVTADILPLIVTLTKSSRGNGAAIRFKANEKRRELLKQNADKIETVCTVDRLEKEAEKIGKQKNRGIAFEKILHEINRETWTHNNTSFEIAPDIEINGIGYQVKYESATFCNEKQINRLKKAV